MAGPSRHAHNRRNNMKVLVTGGTGFIGSAVMKELELRGHEGVSFDRKLGHDVRNEDDLWSVGDDCDHVIHLAGVLGTHELFDTPQLAIDVNITGSMNVLEFCRRKGAGYTGITMPQVFPSLYTATKIATTAFATAYHHTHGVDVSHVRAFNAFGPGQAHGPGHPQKIIPTFAVNAWHDRPLPVWGDGTQSVDLIYTPHLAQILVAAIGFGDDQTFDGGTGVPWTVNEVVDMIAYATRKRVKVDYLPMRRGEIPTQIVATGENWDLLPEWVDTQWNYGDLEETVLWYKDYKAH
jgi:UDP-glucose 4-epimerase